MKLETLMKNMVTRDILQIFSLTDPVHLNIHLADINSFESLSLNVCTHLGKCISRKDMNFMEAAELAVCTRAFHQEVSFSWDDRRVKSWS